MPIACRLVVASIVFGTALVPSLHGQEWTRFRGPNGQGVSTAKGIPVKWTESDYNWKAALPGIGHSSPVLWGGKVFLTSAMNETAERIVLCLDSATGDILWERRYPSSVHAKHLKNSFASATPAVDKEHVYTCWSAPDEYIVLALDHDGREAWRVDLGPVVSQHSTGSSPIVYDGMVVIGNDQDGPIKENPNEGVSFLVALDCRDGRQHWRTPRENAVVSYSTPCVFRPKQGKPQLIFNSQAHGITSIDPATGKVNWELGVFDKRSVSSPIVAAGLIFGTTGSGGGGSYVAAVRPGPQPELAYKITSMAPYVPTLVANDKLLFLWSDKGIVSCVDVQTGEGIWRERVGGNYSGSPVIVDGKLYCIAEDGTVAVLAAGPEYKQLGENPLGEASHSTPAVADGRMYLRTYSHLISVGGKK
ncbi:MAG TPA: PQQ-binding-like beta-propeller repeat protein [Pirellulales bacterium]|jgi:outer membrane protein assembly factor BamB|nr:PQQ-binding-like beta-propeller repeat protein [Pirellulales bacterium]